MGTAPTVAYCPECPGSLRLALRVFEMPNVHFKARGFTGAGRAGGGRVDHFRHADGSPLTDADKNRTPIHAEEES